MEPDGGTESSGDLAYDEAHDAVRGRGPGRPDEPRATPPATSAGPEPGTDLAYDEAHDFR